MLRRGSDVWREKLNYTERWVSAHIADADKMGMPLIVQEFGKAIPSVGGDYLRCPVPRVLTSETNGAGSRHPPRWSPGTRRVVPPPPLPPRRATWTLRDTSRFSRYPPLPYPHLRLVHTRRLASPARQGASSRLESASTADQATTGCGTSSSPACTRWWRLRRGREAPRRARTSGCCTT